MKLIYEKLIYDDILKVLLEDEAARVGV